MNALALLENWKPTLSANEKDSLRQALAEALNQLILHQFEELVQLLYRVDVPEQKLKQVLANNTGTDAGLLLADMLLKRQEEKAALRRGFSPPANDSTEERW